MFIYKKKNKSLKKFSKKDKQFVVYKHTNKINNKTYIGYSSSGMNIRWNSHVGDAMKCKYPNNRFHAAIRKYGAGDDAWQHEILEELDTLLFAKASEIFWINFYQTHSFENYNSTKGGDGSGNKTEQTREKISTSLVEYYVVNPMKQETRTKISIKNRGRKRSEEHNQKMSLALKGKKKPESYVKKMYKGVNQFDRNGVFITTYESIKLAAKVTGVNRANISQCCKHNSHYTHVGGFVWRYVNE